jgi:endonuclease/exonuclease/phosphatase family metal-dependent hydrolase
MRCVVFVLFALGITAAASCDPFHTQFEPIEEAVYYQAAHLVDPGPPGDDLLIMNWNLKFAGGRIDFWFDCYGDRVLMERDEVLENLEALAEKIRLVDPDVLMVQEIDIDSKRGAYIDQVQWILDHTDLNYAVYASQWRADFIPNQGLGRMDMGNATFSKYPLSQATRIGLMQSESQDALTRYFYLKRNIVTAVTTIPGFGSLHLVNIHADAYSQDGTKRAHIDRFKEEIDALDAQGRLVVAGGDLNTLPPGTQVQHGFVDSVCEDEEFIADDYRDEADWLVELYEAYDEAIPLDVYQADNEAHYTHTVASDQFWNRKLDYLFTNGRYVEGSGMTHQDASSGGMDTMPLSDHAPISVRLWLEDPS